MYTIFGVQEEIITVLSDKNLELIGNTKFLVREIQNKIM